jgi:D-alanyl-D-alanine dipeptidase
MAAGLYLQPLPDSEASISLAPIAVPEPSGEPLTVIEHRRVRLLSAYWHAGWIHAVPTSALRQTVANRLYKVAEALPHPLGLAVFDAWRPLALQREIYEAAYADPDLPPGFVARPTDDPSTPPPHVTGGAVDLTLTFDGAALALGTSFDAFIPQANAIAFEDTDSSVRSLRRLLYWRMSEQGFVGIRSEWWHFEYGTSRWAARCASTGMYGPAHL